MDMAAADELRQDAEKAILRAEQYRERAEAATDEASRQFYQGFAVTYERIAREAHITLETIERLGANKVSPVNSDERP